MNITAEISRRLGQWWCGLHGHAIFLHFEPTKLSLQCGLCGYETEGWEVGGRNFVQRSVDSRVRSYHARPERRRSLRAVPPDARMAS